MARTEAMNSIGLTPVMHRQLAAMLETAIETGHQVTSIVRHDSEVIMLRARPDGSSTLYVTTAPFTDGGESG